MFANDIKRGYDFASKHTLCVVPAKAGIQILPRRMPQMDPRFREDDRGILGHLADFLSKENSPRSLMDRMPPSEGGDAGSIPAEGTIHNLVGKFPRALARGLEKGVGEI